MARMSRFNPHHAREGQDARGKTCYFIFNDDGTKTHRFCYSPAKIDQIIAKADRIEARGTPAARRAPAPRPAPRRRRRAPTPPPSSQYSIGLDRLNQLVPLLNRHIQGTCESAEGRGMHHRYGAYCASPPRITRFDKKRRYIYAIGTTGQKEFRIAPDTAEVWRLSRAGSPWLLGTIDQIIARGKTIDESWAENNPW